MPYFSKSCPTCKRMLPLLCATCPQCDSRTEESRASDDAYNHMITLGMRISCIACALVVVASITSTGRRPDVIDYKLMLIILAVSAGLLWGILRLLIGESRRSLWRTALIPSFMIVAGVFVVREVTGQRAAVMAESGAAIEPAAAVFTPASAPSSVKAPLSQVANECFDFVQDQAIEAARHVKNANVRGMFDVDTATAAKASRTQLTQLDRRLLEYDERIRKTATELTSRLQGVRPSSKSAAALVTAVRESTNDLARKARESVAQQRRLIESAQTMLNFLEPRAGRFSTSNQRLSVNNAADTEAFERLLGEFDDRDRAAAAAVRNLQKQCEQSKRRVATATGSRRASAD